jgi:hypothetical protein
MDSWVCPTCGSTHDGVPTGYSFEAPLTCYTIPDGEREQRSVLNSDYCVIENQDYFVRGCLEIPIIGHDEPFILGVWVSLSKANFDREQSLSKNPARVNEPAYFGWLSWRLEIYPDTFALKTNVHSRSVGTRPFIQLQISEHPLAQEQYSGITMHRVAEIAELIKRSWKHPQWDAKPF